MMKDCNKSEEEDPFQPSAPIPTGTLPRWARRHHHQHLPHHHHHSEYSKAAFLHALSFKIPGFQHERRAPLSHGSSRKNFTRYCRVSIFWGRGDGVRCRAVLMGSCLLPLLVPHSPACHAARGVCVHALGGRGVVDTRPLLDGGMMVPRAGCTVCCPPIGRLCAQHAQHAQRVGGARWGIPRPDTPVCLAAASGPLPPATECYSMGHPSAPPDTPTHTPDGVPEPRRPQG